MMNLKEDKNQNHPFAEVIESTLEHVVAQCWRWDNFPDFGSLVTVKSDNLSIFGCVTNIQTGSDDPIRYPFPYKKTEAELKAEQPQIFEFLKTTFSIQIIGYATNENHNYSYSYFLPKNPIKIHSFVENVTTKIYKEFFSKTKYLPLIFSFANNIQNIDELIFAILRNLKSKELLNKEIIKQFLNEFFELTGNDYKRLKLFLSRMDNLLDN